MTPFANSTTWLTGYIPDIPTPFDEAGAVDLKAFAWLCERQIQAGVTAIVVCETAGEFSTLTSAECDAVVRAAAEIAHGRVRVIAGAGSNSTHQAVEQARRAELAGADALLPVVPYYNKPMQAGIGAHFRAIANSTALPVILHDIPARTIRGMDDDTLLKLAERPQFIGLKDSTADLPHLLRLRSIAPAQFRLMSGDDVTALAFLAGGGDGCISIVSNIEPSMCRGIFSSVTLGRLQFAQRLHQRLLPLSILVAEENPAAIKYALSLRGAIRADTRLPLVGLSDQAKARITDAIAAIGEDDLTPAETNASRAISARDHAYSSVPGGTS
jgi:4-hydroxy-tetrahydrodipicolinate synthase